jgi:hypothetical protein
MESHQHENQFKIHKEIVISLSLEKISFSNCLAVADGKNLIK